MGEREGESEREHEEEKVDSTVKEGRFQAGKGGQARRASVVVIKGRSTSLKPVLHRVKIAPRLSGGATGLAFEFVTGSKYTAAFI